MIPNTFYINANIRNNENVYRQASYTETRKEPILTKDIERYQLGVERFSISTNTIPLWIPHIETDVTKNPGSDVDQTIYRVTILDSTTGNEQFSAPLMWTPQISDQDAPSFNIPQTPTRYYYMYTIQHFVDMFNDALDGSGLTSVPRLTFENGKFSLFAGSDYDSNSPTQAYSLVFNEPLSSLLQGFPVEEIQSKNPDHFHQVVFRTTNTNVHSGVSGVYTKDDFVSDQPVGDYMLQMTQERGSLVDFQVFRGIVFTSSSLPIQSEAVGSPTQFGASTKIVQSSTIASENILCDMDCVLEDSAMTNQGVLQYQPKFLHLIDLKEASSIDTLQFNIFWKDNYGNLHPLYLRHGSANVKFVFLRR